MPYIFHPISRIYSQCQPPLIVGRLDKGGKYSNHGTEQLFEIQQKGHLYYLHSISPLQNNASSFQIGIELWGSVISKICGGKQV